MKTSIYYAMLICVSPIVVFILLLPFGCDDSTTILLNLHGEKTEFEPSQITSEVFETTQNEWYIETNCQSLEPSSSPMLAVTIYPSDKSAELPNWKDIVYQLEEGEKTHIIKGDGSYFVVITLTNVKNWGVVIYE